MSLSNVVKNLLQLPGSESLARNFSSLNVIIYASLFLIASYIGLKLVEKKGLKVNRNFYLGLTPVIISAGFLSFIILKAGINPYIGFFALFSGIFTAFILSVKLEPKLGTRYHRILGSIGLTAVVLTGPFIPVPDSGAFIPFLKAFLGWGLPLSLFGILRKELRDFELYLPISSQLLDATTTFTVLNLGGKEKIFFSQFFIQKLGNYGIFVPKIFLIIPSTIYIYRADISAQEKSYYLFIIYALGLGLSSHNFLAMS